MRNVSLLFVAFIALYHIHPSHSFSLVPRFPSSGPPAAQRHSGSWAAPILKPPSFACHSLQKHSDLCRHGRQRRIARFAGERMQVDASGERKGKVCVVGSINFDQTVYVPSMPVPGQTLHGTLYTTGFGGKGANQCVMAALMGAETSMVGMLGTDDIATITRSHLDQVGVKSEWVGTAAGASGVAAITVSADGENHIVVVPGANLLLTPEDIEKSRGAIQGASVLLLQNEIPPATTLAAMKCAKGKGPFVILNAAPAPSVGERWQEGEWRDVGEMLGACDLLCINESETLKLTGVQVGEGDALKVSLKEAAAKVAAMGCPRTIFTLGAAGSCLVDEAGVETIVPLNDKPAKVVDTTGAGDSYLGALAAYLSFGVPLVDAMSKAGRIAAITVTGAGAQTSYPKGDAVPADLRLPK